MVLFGGSQCVHIPLDGVGGASCDRVGSHMIGVSNDKVASHMRGLSHDRVASHVRGGLSRERRRLSCDRVLSCDRDLSCERAEFSYERPIR